MLGVVLSLMVIYNILLPMFSASRSPASLLLVCVPPRPTAAWLLLRSVVPYHSLYLLLLLRPSHQVRLLFLSTSLLSLGYPSPTPPGLFLTGYFNAQISGFPVPPLPLRHVFFWPAILTPRYPVSGTPLPLRHDFFWPAILTPRSPFSGTPGPSFHSLFWYPWSSVSTPSFFPTQPSLPGYLGGRLALCAALRFACDFYRSAVFTAPRFLPLRGFYRSAFTSLLGALLFRRPHACCPPVFTHFRAARSLCRLAVRLRFLPLRGFYRSAVFTALRFFTAPLSPVFWGALLFRRPPACCPPVFVLFRAHPVVPARP